LSPIFGGANPLERFAIIGDVHADDEALGRALAFSRNEGVDAILAVGDIVDGVGDAGACCRLLAEAMAVVVRGNHDRWFLNGTFRDLPDATQAGGLEGVARTFLASLPAVRRIVTPRGGLLLCHGTGEDDMHAVLPDDAGYALETNDELQRVLRDPDTSIMVSGHSHRRLVRRIGSLTLINAGTLARSDGACFGIVDLGRTPKVTFFTWTARAIVRAEIVDLST
jgi:predicted phosphodiesterase